MKMEEKKWWLKSKTIITSFLIALLSVIDIVFQSVHDLINDNLEYLKSALSAKYVSIILFVLAIINIYTRLKATEKLVSRKNCKKEKKDANSKKLP